MRQYSGHFAFFTHACTLAHTHACRSSRGLQNSTLRSSSPSALALLGLRLRQARQVKARAWGRAGSPRACRRSTIARHQSWRLSARRGRRRDEATDAICGRMTNPSGPHSNRSKRAHARHMPHKTDGHPHLLARLPTCPCARMRTCNRRCKLVGALRASALQCLLFRFCGPCSRILVMAYKVMAFIVMVFMVMVDMVIKPI